jgi:hypothetical protein
LDVLHLENRPDAGHADLFSAFFQRLRQLIPLVRLELWLDLRGDAELVEDDQEIDAGLAFPGVADRLCAQQRPLEGIDRADVGRRNALASGNAQARATEHRLRICRDFSLLDEFLDQLGARDCKIECFAGLDLSLDDRDDDEFGDDLVPGRALELRNERGDGAPHTGAGENLDFRCEGHVSPKRKARGRGKRDES